jgi:hypothetical protein
MLRIDELAELGCCCFCSVSDEWNAIAYDSITDDYL